MQSSELRWDDVALAQQVRKPRPAAPVPSIHHQGKQAVSFDLSHETSEPPSHRSSLVDVGLFPIAEARHLPEGRAPRYRESTIPQGIRALARSPQPTDVPPPAQTTARGQFPQPNRQSLSVTNAPKHPAQSPQFGKPPQAPQASQPRQSLQVTPTTHRVHSSPRSQTPPRLSPEAHARAVANAKRLSPNEPKLPRFKALSPRPQPTPAKQPAPRTAMNLLRDVEATVILWQERLHRVANEVRQLYDEGPIVEGWLETRPLGSPAGYLQSSSASASPAAFASGTEPNLESQAYLTGVSYFVCKRDSQGQKVSYPCPVEQVASVSLAISRYQKLQYLHQQKRQIEHRLAKIAEILVVFHGQIRAIGSQ